MRQQAHMRWSQASLTAPAGVPFSIALFATPLLLPLAEELPLVFVCGEKGPRSLTAKMADCMPLALVCAPFVVAVANKPILAVDTALAPTAFRNGCVGC